MRAKKRKKKKKRRSFATQVKGEGDDGKDESQAITAWLDMKASPEGEKQAEGMEKSDGATLVTKVE